MTLPWSRLRRLHIPGNSTPGPPRKRPGPRYPPTRPVQIVVGLVAMAFALQILLFGHRVHPLWWTTGPSILIGAAFGGKRPRFVRGFSPRSLYIAGGALFLVGVSMEFVPGASGKVLPALPYRWRFWLAVGGIALMVAGLMAVQFGNLALYERRPDLRPLGRMDPGPHDLPPR